MPSGKRHVLSRLLDAYRGNHSRDCPSLLLRGLCRHLDAFGAVLWQATEGADPKATPPLGNLFMLATWFPKKEIFAIHNLELEGTVAGPVVCSGKPVIMNHVKRDGGRYREHPFLLQHRLTRLIAFPFQYKDGTPGALTIYRSTEQADFNEANLREIKEAFRHFPALLDQAQSRSRLELLAKITGLFQDNSLESPDHEVRERTWKRILDETCEEVAKVFHAAEASIILRKSPSSEAFVCKAVKTSSAHRRRVMKAQWRADLAQGRLTALALATGESVRIFDLLKCETDLREIRAKYPAFEWTVGSQLETDARVALGPSYRDSTTPLPPLAFLAIPIGAGDRLHGCIRCWIARPPLSYFSAHDQRLLALVAGQIAIHYEALQHDAETSSEIEVWRKLGQAWRSISRHHEAVEFKGPRPVGRAASVDPFTIVLLNLLRDVIPNAEMNALWLCRDQTERLSCVVAPLLLPGEQRAPHIASLWQRYVYRDIEPDAAEMLAEVHRTQEPVCWAVDDSRARHSIVLPGVKAVLTVPVRTRDKKVGVLQIGSPSSEPFPGYAEGAAGFVANLLAHHLVARDALNEAQRYQLERAENEKFTNEAFRDIMHQMKGPLLECAKRIRSIAHDLGGTSPVGQRALVASQLAESASRVSRRVGILAQLSRKGSIQAARQVLNRRAVADLLREAWVNVSYRVHPSRKIFFAAEFDKIEAALPQQVVTDPELLLHAVQNVMDNAAKYSYPNNEVRMTATRSSSGGWLLHISNKGIPLHENEVRLARQRGWRGQIAQLSTGEGSGIGLWIVDRILQALGADFQIHPTNPDGWTHVVISFRLQPTVQDIT